MDFYHKLSEAAGADHILKDEPMSAHTTFRIGGPADYFVVPEDAASLGRGVALCRAEGVDYFITGNGSNLLVGDGGYRGVVFIFVIQWMMLPMRKKGQNCWWKQVPV